MNKLLFFALVLLPSCGPNYEDLKPPIILVAKSKGGTVVLTDGKSTVIMNSDFAAAHAISQSYNPGDTLFYFK